MSEVAPLVVIPPALRTLPLPEKVKELFARALRLAQRPGSTECVRVWLEEHYTQDAIYRRLLPDMQRSWQHDRRDLTAAPTKGELDWWTGASRDGFTTQYGSTFVRHLAQHRHARRHPGYSLAIAERRARLRALKAEQASWRPTRKDRLELAVRDLVDAEYPEGADEHLEHSRRIVAIASLLMPGTFPALGELGVWPFASCLNFPTEPTGDWLEDVVVASAAEASKGPHGYRPTMLDRRDVGRGEVMFERLSGEHLAVADWFPLEKFAELLGVAVDELGQVGTSPPADVQNITLDTAPSPSPLPSVPPPIPTTAAPVVPDGFYSPTDIAKAMGMPSKSDAIRMALKRLFDNDRLPDGAWMENNNPAKGQSRILYRLSLVRPHLARFESDHAT